MGLGVVFLYIALGYRRFICLWLYMFEMRNPLSPFYIFVFTSIMIFSLLIYPLFKNLVGSWELFGVSIPKNKHPGIPQIWEAPNIDTSLFEQCQLNCTHSFKEWTPWPRNRDSITIFLQTPPFTVILSEANSQSEEILIQSHSEGQIK